LIREFEHQDAEPVSAILHEEQLPHVVTPAGLLHWLEAQPERARPRMFVAEEDGRIVGWGESRLTWATSAQGVGEFWIYAPPAHRGRGIGRALYAAVERYLQEIGARTLQTWTYTEAAFQMLERRGFRPTGTERIGKLELADADLSGLERLEDEKAAEGFRLARLRDVGRDVEGLHRLYAALSADVPEFYREDDIRLEEWQRETLENPQLSHEGSSVVMEGDWLVALAFVEVDEAGKLAANDLTGTLPEFRRRGLARLAKLGTIRWAAEHGIRSILTCNADTNVGMVTLNKRLGYRRVLTETHLVRE
jgi:GNAT superfamily N-acetyltransferase